MNFERLHTPTLIAIGLLAVAVQVHAGGFTHGQDMQIIDEGVLIELPPFEPTPSVSVTLADEAAEQLKALLAKAGAKRESKSPYVSSFDVRNLICKGYGTNLMCQVTDTNTGRDLLLSADASRELKKLLAAQVPKGSEVGTLPKEINCRADAAVAYPQHAGPRYERRSEFVHCRLLY